ncbi:hypothetical protein As57867_012589, partial [Aphanomyces stellatus]
MPSASEQPSSAQPHYELTPLSDGGAMIVVRSEARSATVILITIFALAALAIAVAICVANPEVGIGQVIAVLVALVIDVYFGSMIVTSVYGVERYVISATSFTRHWQVLCFRGTKQYDFANMGPIHYVASAWRSTDENDQLADAKTTDRTAHVQIGFRYGAQDVRLDNFFNDNEVDIFLQDISP